MKHEQQSEQGHVVQTVLYWLVKEPGEVSLQLLELEVACVKTEEADLSDRCLG